MTKHSIEKPIFLQCNKDFLDEILREILKRLYLPIYIPLIALIACILVVKSRDYWGYSRFKFFLFINGFLTISLSEISSFSDPMILMEVFFIKN